MGNWERFRKVFQLTDAGGVMLVWSFWTWPTVCGQTCVDGAEDCSADYHPSVQKKKHKVKQHKTAFSTSGKFSHLHDCN